MLHKGVDGARHMANKTSSRCKTKGLQEQGKGAKLIVDIIRVKHARQKESKCHTEVQENNAQKVKDIKSKTKAQDYRIRGTSQKCKSKVQDKHSRHCIKQTEVQDKGALHIR